MMKITSNIIKNMLKALSISALTMTLSLLANSDVWANCNGTTPQCSEAAKCKPATKGNDIFYQNASTRIDSKCVWKNTKTSESCFDSAPVSWVGSYNMPGYRKCSSGDNCKGGQRNHYGSDLGTSKQTDIIAYAATDGVVGLYDERAGGSGRTLVITHEKKCSNDGKGKKLYSTVYRHLFKVYVEKDDEVKKGTKIGIVGGSSHTKAKGLCDNPLQPGIHCKGASKSNGEYYDIHLHLEIMDTKVAEPANTLTTGASNTYMSACGNIQALCGGCSNDIGSCKKNGAVTSAGDGSRANLDGLEAVDGASAEPRCNASSYFDKESCMFCPLFKTLFNAASNIAYIAIKKLSAPSKGLVIIGFAIWLAYMIMKQIASVQKAAPADMLKEIIFQGTRVAVVVFILSGDLFQVMDLTINPVVETGLTFARSLNEKSNCPEQSSYLKDIRGYGAGLNDNNEGGLAHSMGTSIVCTIKNLEDTVGLLASLGNYSICTAFYDRAVWSGVIPHLGFLTTGLFLWGAGMFLLLTFPWCLVDAILQLCIAAAMIPCSIAAYAFKATAKYIKTVWDFFMNAMFNLVFLAVVTFIINSMFLDWIGYKDTDVESFITDFDPENFVYSGDGGLAWWGLASFKIAAACFLFYCFFGEAGRMAQVFAAGAGLTVGSQVGSSINDAAKKAGKGAAKMGWKATKTATKAVGQGVNSLAGNWARSKLNQAKGLGLLALGGRKLRDEKGNVIGYQARFKIPGFTQTRTVTKDANGVWTQNKETHQKTAADKMFKPMKDENGDTVFGVKTGRNQYEQMEKSVDAATGNIIYTSQDGKSKLITDKDGNILQYKGSSDKEMKNEVHNGSVRTINDTLMKKRVMTDAKGNVIGTDVSFKNVSSKYLINKDGSTNMHAFNQIMKGVSAENKADAMAAMVDRHMAARGQNLDNRFKNRKVEMDKDGGITITQTNRDGSVQIVSAQMVGEQMVIRNQITDTKGNVTIQKTNGLQNKTTSFSKQKDGTYKKSVKYSFTDEVHGRSRLSDPLDKEGVWGYGMDPYKAMAGFNANDFQEHLNQLANGKIKDTLLTEVQMLMETNNKQLSKLADSQRGATILHGLVSAQSQNPDTQQKNIDANTYLQQFNMSTPSNYNARGHSLPKSRFDKNGVKHIVKYAQNGDYSDTFKQKDGSSQTLIYGKDNKVKAKIVIDKNNNETRIMYKNDGIDVFKNNSSGGITRQSFDKDKNLLFEVVQDKDGHSPLDNVSETSSPTRAELLDISAALQENIVNGIVDSQEQMMAQELIKQELQSIIDDPTQLFQMKDNDLKETVMLADAAVKDADGRRDADLDKLLNDAMAVMTPQQKAELMLTANLSKELAAQLVS